MKILKAIASVLAAVTMLVAVWVASIGRFVMRCMPGYRPADPRDVVEAYAEAVEEATAVPALDQRLENIRLIADHLFRQKPVPDALFEGLGQHTVQWLGALDADMLISVAKSKPAELRAHLRGERSIRGVLAADTGSVFAYLRAVQTSTEPVPEPAHVRRQRKRQEPLLPAFGNMC